MCEAVASRGEEATSSLSLLLMMMNEPVTDTNRHVVRNLSQCMYFAAKQCTWMFSVVFDYVSALGVVREGDLMCFSKIAAALPKNERAFDMVSKDLLDSVVNIVVGVVIEESSR